MEKLLELILKVRPVLNAETLMNTVDLYRNGVIDSFDILTIVAAIEETYGIRIATDITRYDFRTIETLYALILRHGGH